MKVEAFRRQAEPYLPGFVFSFNIADFKRRNSHLTHSRGDRDIDELDRLLAALAAEQVLVARLHGQRWFMVSRNFAKDRVQSLLHQYAGTDRITTGWAITARKNGGTEARKTDQRLVCTEISRAIRCLYAQVETPDDLAAAIERIAHNDHDLPVNVPIDLADVPLLERKKWVCVSQYPLEDPFCPFCGGRDFAWEGGDGSIYTGDGRCKTCGADISITQVDMAESGAGDRSPAVSNRGLSDRRHLFPGH